METEKLQPSDPGLIYGSEIVISTKNGKMICIGSVVYVGKYHVVVEQFDTFSLMLIEKDKICKELIPVCRV